MISEAESVRLVLGGRAGYAFAISQMQRVLARPLQGGSWCLDGKAEAVSEIDPRTRFR